jgi:membrane protease YdiL (CAAX protease family)
VPCSGAAEAKKAPDQRPASKGRFFIRKLRLEMDASSLPQSFFPVASFSFKSIPASQVLPIFFLIVFLGPVVLGPVLYFFLEPMHIPFHRVMSRALLISALGALILFRDRLHFRQWWPLGRTGWVLFGKGWLIAFVSAMAIIGLDGLFCGFDWSGASAQRTLLTATIAALIVPIVEETLFRGFLVTLLVEAAGRRVGWFLAAVIFALAHFLRIPSGSPAQPVHLWSGVTGMIAAFGQMGQAGLVGGHGYNLLLIGLILGGIFLRDGRLWFCAGMHSGWIFILMAFSGLSRPEDPSRFPLFSGDLLGSPITTGVLLILGLFLWRFFPRRRHGRI